MTDDATLSLIDTRIRNWYRFLTPDIQSYVIDSWQATFGIRDRRNVQLWLTSAATQRRFVNRNLSSEEFEMRLSFAKSLLGMRFITAPQKIREIILDPLPAGRKLRNYLTNDHIQLALKSVEFLDDRIILSYDQDSPREGDAVSDADVNENQGD